jgi:hypothetical protein
MLELVKPMPRVRAIYGEVITRLLDGELKDEKNASGWTYAEQLARDMFLHPKSAAELTAKASAKGCLPAVKAAVERAAALNAPKLALLDHVKRIERFWTDAPYCIHRLEGGSWLPLNRSYKPLGGDPGRYYDYEACAGQAWSFRADPHGIEDVWQPDMSEEWLYITYDLSRVRGEHAAYLRRLRRILADAVPGVGGLRVQPAS